MFKYLLIFSLALTSVSASAAPDSIALGLLNKVYDYKDLLNLGWPFSRPSEDEEPISIANEMKDRIIIAGDSWAVFPCDFRSLTKVLSATSMQLVNDGRCKSTSRLGIEAAEWLGSPEDLALTNILKADARVKYMYLSLGGNDLMSLWNTNMTPAQEQAISDKIISIVQKIMNKYLAINPNLKIVLSGYDFTHFKENHPIPLYSRIYKRMGKPGTHRINSALADFSRSMTQVIDYKNKFYIHHLGISHYYDGIGPTVLGLPTTNSPDLISPYNHPEMVGGNLYYKNREESMMLWLKLFYDAFHLNEQNYYNVMLHTYNNMLIHIVH